MDLTPARVAENGVKWCARNTSTSRITGDKCNQRIAIGRNGAGLHMTGYVQFDCSRPLLAGPGKDPPLSTVVARWVEKARP